MILDSIIGLFASLFGFLAEGVAIVFVPVINLILAAIEALIAVFVSGFSLGRIESNRRGSRTPASAIGGILTLLIVFGAISFFIIAPKVMNRTVTLVAEDGHSLPFAGLIIQTNGADRHVRTDNAGNIVIPRFATTGITVKDPRYLQKTWHKPEIKSELVVRRTILGSGLDSLAGRLLKPANE